MIRSGYAGAEEEEEEEEVAGARGWGCGFVEGGSGGWNVGGGFFWGGGAFQVSFVFSISGGKITNKKARAASKKKKKEGIGWEKETKKKKH